MVLINTTIKYKYKSINVNALWVKNELKPELLMRRTGRMNVVHFLGGSQFGVRTERNVT